ncbi:unnamed protein product [Ectocarpus sp. 12 AP-2014]
MLTLSTARSPSPLHFPLVSSSSLPVHMHTYHNGSRSKSRSLLSMSTLRSPHLMHTTHPAFFHSNAATTPPQPKTSFHRKAIEVGRYPAAAARTNSNPPRFHPTPVSVQ